MDADYETFHQNPKLDILFGYFKSTIPSKREDFKPIEVVGITKDGQEEVLKDFYVKKPTTQSVRNFEKMIHDEIIDKYSDFKILKPALVEVVITISITQSKFFDIDLDNIAKTVLDTLTGHLFEDDSQVSNLIVQKNIHPLNMDGFFIGVTELKGDRKGILGDLHLFSGKEWK